MGRPPHIVKPLQGQRGGAAILFVLCLPVMLGFAALAVDLARLNLTRVELQNAADAAALAGVRSLSDPSTVAADQPCNWSAATAMALDVARRNVANGVRIQDALIETGYWNLHDPSLGLRSPGTPGVPVAGDVAAVRATIAISGTQNNGPLKLFFAPVLGIAERNIQARALAVTAPPGAGTGMFPVVINMAMFTHYWDTATRTPKLDPATGKPYVFDIGSSYFSAVSGGWTSFATQDNDSQTLRQLIAQGNTTELSIGDLTWLPSGVKADVYNYIPANKDVPLFVVNSIVTNSWQPIVAIAGFHVIGTVGKGANSKIEGQFLYNLPAGTTNPGSGNGLPLGAYSPPILVE
ncbi:MAG: hypothetical protein HGB04_04235 [Chlorobiaceae bacterium]|nr:hypothetical protein [Chlorobiaceae bacterium]